MLIILDRDGVINQDSDLYIKTVEEWIPISGSIEAIALLKKAGHTVVIASNQSGLSRGLFSIETLNAMHDKLNHLLNAYNATIDGIYYCPHLPTDNCHCRKPKSGLLEKIQQDFKADMHKAWMIGDSIKDLQVGQRMGCQLALVRTGKGEQSLQDKSFDFSSVVICNDLMAAVEKLSCA
ncbi:MAG: D-glycero-beta-D-manno-heptose-1,7-bisphosphate 7-phosphatase [Gammaproteobacteria bacterium RIFCSPHIGHO2_12_FULL_41_15]|nr:MAG: D-glycero-beta-D-manno-heptose-1,7-bisphosphate 7-phosphatase [Gammaproteobacteria bacterium RIFCSPHIGHO2_12_FULL_41_15]